MLKLNKKGQASSTFQLLIAAVVALAILGVLLSILNIIPGPNTEPGDATKTLLKTQMESPGEEQCTTDVTFDTSHSRLSTQAVTEDTGLDEKQVYFDNPEGLSQFEFSDATVDDESIENQLLKYMSTRSYKVVICVVCSNSIDGLDSALSMNGRDGDDFVNVDDIGLTDNQTICAIYPRKTR